jgi:uncharacterized protein YdaU (DUF1376 family)
LQYTEEPAVNFYPFHIGDYATATGHLSWLEDLAYRRLLDTYYAHEAPLPAEVKAVCRLLRAHEAAQQEAVRTVLEEFFELGEQGWRHKRCETEIAAMTARRKLGADAAHKRWRSAGDVAAMPTHASGNAETMPTHDPGNARAMPTHSSGITEAMPTHAFGNATNTNTKPNTKTSTTPNPPPSNPGVGGRGTMSKGVDTAGKPAGDSDPNANPNPPPSNPGVGGGGIVSTGVNAAGKPASDSNSLPPAANPGAGGREIVSKAIDAAAEPASDPPDAAGALPGDPPDAARHRKLAGAACQLMGEAGVRMLNSSHPELISLIGRGITPRQLGDLAREIAQAKPGKPMQYVLAMMRNRLHHATQPPAYGGYRPALREVDVGDTRSDSAAPGTRSDSAAPGTRSESAAPGTRGNSAAPATRSDGFASEPRRDGAPRPRAPTIERI